MVLSYKRREHVDIFITTGYTERDRDRERERAEKEKEGSEAFVFAVICLMS
ncbi:conserved hypothetical protein [Ricinus communis]|uniref:Uncharacterized protein n=1 Tax=Ricinus communis TaxID=3988 RepID=B9SSL5_RICCO|nr:conserved hypothetical protein [Ricinus communis]